MTSDTPLLAAGWFIADEAAPEVRPTNDVDVIVETLTRSDYYVVEEKLRSLGFAQPMEEDSPICRWAIQGVNIDVMPTDEKILGFANRWYSEAIKHAIRISLSKGLEINIVTAPFFLATKIEAFYGRGEGDFIASPDLEDIIPVFDGRPNLSYEVRDSEKNLKNFLSERFRLFLNSEDFLEALPGHLLPDTGSQARLPEIMARMEEMTRFSDIEA
jgi:hypothetical protein